MDDEVQSTDSTKLFLIREHYEQRKEELRWDRDRYLDLAGRLRLSVYELGAMFRASTSEVQRWVRAGRFPPHIELHLTLLERAYFPSANPPPFFPLSHD